ncbi:Nitrogen assimilation regulatory protein [Enhygromyxa salina]|uniref:Nitrogen assimilation regulatory protein n=2 Tax=Enhygromyxa salina TaxID=215803 RepID=A0A2S9YDH7_9BACT|nr:Nitrogen assimilation regulatory protein [Enhygromyxa salina]
MHRKYSASTTPRPSESTAARSDLGLPVVGARMQAIVARLATYATLPETLLLTGPTGTGKSSLARWVHQQSSRRQAPFVTVDLLSVPRDMQMGELFGWRRGAFTGAVRDQDGGVTRAGAGTLFIDEIDKLSLACQAGLLRLLEDRSFRVLGDDRQDRRCSARIIVGTNSDLEAAVARGEFREDLYYRVHVLVTEIPPLDARRDEIPAWANFMAARRCDEAGGCGSRSLSRRACELLCAAEWPGNLRQLDNVVRRAWALCLAESPEAGQIEAGHVSLALTFECHHGHANGSILGELERAADTLIDEMLARSEHLELGDLDVFRGIVLERAAARLGGMREAFALFEANSTIERRNQARAFKRAQARTRGLRSWLNED